MLLFEEVSTCFEAVYVLKIKYYQVFCKCTLKLPQTLSQTASKMLANYIKTTSSVSCSFMEISI